MTCHAKAKYLPTKEFSGDFPFRFMLDWYRYQEDFVNGLDTLSMTREPITQDSCSLFEVALYSKKKHLADDVQLTLFGDRLELTGGVTKTFAFAEIHTITILGKNKLNVYHGDMVYQIQGSPRFNAVKYLNLYHRYKNLTSEVPDGRFLGL